MNVNYESVDMPTLNNASEGDDDFNYDDPILAALIGKNWDEEIAARKNTTDIIADVEAINDILEMAAYKTPEKVKTLIVSKSTNIRNTSSPATVGSIHKTTSKSHTNSPVPIQNFEKGSSSHHARPKEDSEEDEPTPSLTDSKALKTLMTMNLTMKLNTTMPPPMKLEPHLPIKNHKQLLSPIKLRAITSPLTLMKSLIKSWKQPQPFFTLKRR
ncbi:hypothetical protein Salat_2903400 [Sesamum alatum]|uniref:Uncharacterized protein n=1 Tax=Sesamum alatum TaxID=300844 RepID=A0AAE2C859_9LAMI|nr:hypothetical protein Salat_2903400 [Sesamum alatum]